MDGPPHGQHRFANQRPRRGRRVSSPAALAGQVANIHGRRCNPVPATACPTTGRAGQNAFIFRTSSSGASSAGRAGNSVMRQNDRGPLPAASTLMQSAPARQAPPSIHRHAHAVRYPAPGIPPGGGNKIKSIRGPVKERRNRQDCFSGPTSSPSRAGMRLDCLWPKRSGDGVGAGRGRAGESRLVWRARCWPSDPLGRREPGGSGRLDRETFERGRFGRDH